MRLTQPYRLAKSLPLFEWDERQITRPLAVVRLQRRYRLPVATAAMVAELAGLGGGAAW
jgi:hypothetical protein